MTTYKIIARTNPYIAARDINFKGKTEVVLESGLNLREAYRKLLDLYNEKYSGERPYASNWGLAVIQSNHHCFGAVKTFNDTTRSFDWDSRSYDIEPENDENHLD